MERASFKVDRPRWLSLISSEYREDRDEYFNAELASAGSFRRWLSSEDDDEEDRVVVSNASKTIFNFVNFLMMELL
jgi:hypothetical protein